MIKPNKQQRGFSLFMVMIIMLVIALLVVVSSQSASTEMRISTNEADHKFALSLAETGLRDAENEIARINSPSSSITTTYDYSCTNGNCAPVEDVHWENNGQAQSHFQISGTKNNVVSWKRTFNGESVFDNNGATSYPANDSGTQQAGTVRYIIEFMGERTEGSVLGRYFRVTARAKGRNANTIVILQSYVEASS